MHAACISMHVSAVYESIFSSEQVLLGQLAGTLQLGAAGIITRLGGRWSSLMGFIRWKLCDQPVV